MKNKPTRHKETNTFKFQPFSDRISQLDVDVFHRIGHKNEEYKEEETFFHQTLQKWNSLNLSESFDELRKELPSVETLPLLLIQRDVVIDVILKHLSKRSPLALEAILDLLAALMKDLRHEVYPSYSNILQKLCELLSTKNADELEWIFTCLAYMFKYLWRYIVKDVDSVFDNLVPLFSDSKPMYIKNFAAESFAYIVRKVKNKKDFVKLIVKTLESRPDSIEGCGQLMFQVVRGIHGRFHSFAQDFLPLILEMLYDSSLNCQLLYDLLKHMINAMCTVIEPKCFSLFWNSAFDVIFKYDQRKKKNTESQLLILKLVKLTVQYKQGLLLTEPHYVIPHILKLLETVDQKSISEVLSKIVALILLSPSAHLHQENAGQLISSVLMLSHEQTVLDFICQILLYPGFETFVLPWIQTFICKEIQRIILSPSSKSEETWNETVFKLLPQIILQKGSPCLDGVSFENWKKYPLDLSISSRNPNKKVCVFETLFQERFSTYSIQRDNFEECISILLLLPHVNLIQKEVVIVNLKKLTTKLCSELHNYRISNEQDEKTLQKILFVFLILLEAQIHVMDFQNVEEVCGIEFMIDDILPLAKNPSFISALCAVDLYLTAMKLEVCDKDVRQQLMRKVCISLLGNLSSSYHKIRFLTTHILSLFVTDSENALLFIKTCFDIESVSVSVQNVRDKILLLEKLSFDLIKSDDFYLEVPLRFLLGVLYENFQLLWEPVMHLIASFARGMAVPRFWQVFKIQLELAVQNINKSESAVKICCTFSNCSITKIYNSLHDFDDRPDYSNYRVLLWKSLAEFPELCEMKNRDLSPMFLDFLENEYFKENSNDVQFCSVKLFESVDNGNINAEKTEKSLNERRKTDNRTKRAQLYQTLLAHMKVFAKLKSPKSVYKEPLLTSYYFSLLSHKNSNIQKVALDCLMCYREAYLAPYREHLYGLLDDKMFKSEIALFHIDQDNSIVQEEHRAELLPVLIRILYGRMLTKTGRGSTGKGAAKLRRSLVLRFLSGCCDNEMIMFMELAFKVFFSYFCDKTKIMVDEVIKNINLNNVISLKSLRSSLNLLLIVMEKFGALMGNEVLLFLLKILICIGSLISGILAHKTEIHAGYASGLRSLQSTCILVATKFFSQFSDYPWIPEDLEVFFSLFVWPGLEKLSIEGIHNPTALLKLFASWSRNPRYFNLLVKSKECESCTPLSAIIKLLAAPKIQPSVTSTIMEMLELLLTTADSEDGVSETNVLNFSEKLPEDLNYGSKILLPHVPAIIQNLQQKLVIKKKKGLNSRDLLILSRVCELVVDAETSESLLKLLFLTLIKKVNGTEETVIHLVSTVCNLMRNVSAPFKYLRCIAPLFGSVSPVGARKMLCELLTELIGKDKLDRSNVSENVQILLDINAWDAKWVEQPDFACRLEGFKSSYEMIEKEKLRLDFGLILVYNCFYFLKYEKDMALKDSSSFCLRKLSPYLCKQAMLAKNTHVPETILKLISLGIREKSNENLHDEAITLLGELVRESCDTHPTLLDMKDLASKEDPEIDFFNNIIHLQSHRRARALIRFCSVAKQMTKPLRIQTLTQFILPMVSSFLCSEKYRNKINVVDAGVLSIGIVCKFLPWFHYETVLKYYLRKLHSLPAFQKQLVRVVVSILDGFHFDISLAKEIHKSNKDGKLNAPINELFEGRNAYEDRSKTFEESDEVKGECNPGNAEMVPAKLRWQKDRETVKEKDASDSIANDDDDIDDSKLTLEEELEDAMDNVPDEERKIIESKELLHSPNEEPYVLQPIKLSETAATRVIRSITGGLLPLLQQTISQHKKSERVHKVNRKKTAGEQEEEDTMCIPVALAIVKLLQQLPSRYLNQYLPNIFLNICNYLKSRLESVRRIAREMLQKIMASLGPSYLSILLNEMLALLTKGFHIHVLIFTIHSVLSSIKSTFKPGDLDECVSQLLEICKLDLFGKASEEKDVKKIIQKVSEARSHKSYDTLKIAAQFVTEKCFVDLLLPFKEVLTATNSFSFVVRVSESLHRIVIGFHDNAFVSVESLLIFIYGVASNSIGALKVNNKQNADNDRKSTHVKQTDSFLILQAPRTRYGAITAKPKVSSDRNVHVLVEFSFKLLYILLKRGKAANGDFSMYIDPLIPILQNNLNTQHVKLTTASLNCFACVLKMDLPNLRKNINAISNSFFNLLHKYATAGLSQGEYQEMVIAAFKAITVLVRYVKYYVINDLQLKALLLYIENDMHNFTKQSTAFPLLKAILSRKLDVPEIYQVMSKVAELSIVSNYDQVRGQARLVFYHFLMNFPLGEKVEAHINFYISQLSYELEPGRLSAFQIIHRMISTFPESTFSKYSGTLFVTIGAALVNDERTSCKKMAAKCLKTLISRDEKNRDKLFGVTLTWLKEQKIAHRTMGAQICGMFVEVQTDSFLRHMKDLLPIVQNQLSAKMNFMYASGKCIRLAHETHENEEIKEMKLRLEDHCIFQVLRLIKKICSLCPSFLTDNCWMFSVEGLGDAAQHLLAHPHEWIRLEAAAVLGHIFASLDIKALVETVNSSSYVEGRYLFNETERKLKSLVLDFCAQLVPNSVGLQLIEQVTKNLAFLSRVFQAFPDDIELPEENGVKISLLWMIRRMRKIVNMELLQTPSSYTLRGAVFKWIGALVVDLNRERLQSVITQILAPLARELLNEEESNPDLLRLARGVTKIMKKKLGMEEYSKQLSKLQLHLAARRAVRKRERVQQCIHNPEMAAKRKLRKHQKKKIVKKRKMDEWKGRVAPKLKRKFKNTVDLEPYIPRKQRVSTEVVTEVAIQ